LSPENELLKKVFTVYEKNNISASVVAHKGYKEYFISAPLAGPADLLPALDELFAFLKQEGAQVVLQLTFGDSQAKAEYLKLMALRNVKAVWPVLALENDGAKISPLSGMQFIAVSGVELTEINIKGRLAGYSFEDAEAKYAYLADLRPENIISSPADQTREVFKRVLEGLEEAGMDFSNVVRTWFYLDRLLSWYGLFNEARTGFFKEHGVFQNLVPASTGIGARNREGAALAACIYAVKPKAGSVSLSRVSSPLQCEAFNYKSAFSRAVELQTGNTRKLLISGTASISADGKSANIGSSKKQIALTMEIVEKLLLSRKMTWENVTRAIVYFKEQELFPDFKKYCEENNIPAFPTVLSAASVCREELLFEIEADAVAGV